MSEIQHTLDELLGHYHGNVQHGRGPAGDVAFRSSTIKTKVLQLTDESLHNDEVSPDAADDLLAYFGWNIWDVLGMRATEGESGLIPRQEYEALADVQYIHGYPELCDLITDAIGADGVVEIGAIARKEIGTKANALHAWCAGASFVTGRGIVMALGHGDRTYRSDAIRRALQFCRRLYRGIWGDEGAMFASMRGYKMPLLEGTSWLERFRAEAIWFEEPEQRQFYARFNATTQLLTFLLYFDSRLGLGDSGPYPTADGGFVIVRDHFLNDPAFHWSDVAEELPHAITQAMYFRPPPEMKVVVNDLATTFTQPGNYLPYLSGMAVYARDKWDTPASGIRFVDEEELQRIAESAQKATMRLYRRIARMSRRDLIAAGTQTYVLDWALPWVRLAGVWDKAIAHGWLEWDQLTSESYYPLVVDGRATTLMPEVVIATPGSISMQA
jgi:hypothetical protein